MFSNNLIRSLALAALIVILPSVALSASQEATGPAATSVTDMELSFKLDSKVTQAVYMGERWVSPPTYSGVQTGKTFTVEAKAEGVDAKGKLTDISPAWTPSDPDMVGVSPAKGHKVEITVRSVGESTLDVSSQGFSRKLLIKATYRDNAIQVDISQ